MKRRIIETSDGSKTIQIDDWNERYHSHHGAIQESIYVYIDKGLKHFLSAENTPKKPISILEMGFGTGLNALLTYQYATANKVPIEFTTIEAYPISAQEFELLNYSELLNIPLNIFKKIHECDWEKYIVVNEHFSIKKQNRFFQDMEFSNDFDIIYFDAFGSRVQPELWEKSIFEIMYKSLNNKGILVTYAAIGQVKRDMKSLGFEVERLDGPPNKRHMLRATKVG